MVEQGAGAAAESGDVCAGVGEFAAAARDGAVVGAREAGDFVCGCHRSGEGTGVVGCLA